MKKSKKKTIRIYFKDGKMDEIPQKLWDDYSYERGRNETGAGMFVVIRKGAWIAMYSMDEIACITVG